MIRGTSNLALTLSIALPSFAVHCIGLSVCSFGSMSMIDAWSRLLFIRSPRGKLRLLAIELGLGTLSGHRVQRVLLLVIFVSCVAC